MKLPIPRSGELLDRIKDALTPDRLPLLIAIDGACHAGKSSLAAWLAWQLAMPAVELDLYLTGLDPIRWRTDDLARVVANRAEKNSPLIIDGILVLDALAQIGREPDFLVFVNGGRRRCLGRQLAAYRRRNRAADFAIDGYAELARQARQWANAPAPPLRRAWC